MTKEDYRARLVRMVKAAGQEVINRADDFIGDADMLTDFDIWLRFPNAFMEPPVIEVSKSAIIKQAINVVYNQDAIHNERL